MLNKEFKINPDHILQAQVDFADKPMNLSIVFNYLTDELKLDGVTIDIAAVVFDKILNGNDSELELFGMYEFETKGDMKEVPMGVLKAIIVLNDLNMFVDYPELFSMVNMAKKLYLLSNGFLEGFDTTYKISDSNCEVLNNLTADYYRRWPYYEHNHRKKMTSIGSPIFI